MAEYKLPGCTTRPMASYLKALALFRLVAEQKDPYITACWEQGTFKIKTDLAPDALEHFLCNEYIPTPIITPWNGGSGFYPGDPRHGMDAILHTDDPRFQEYKQAITSVFTWPEWTKQFDTAGELLDVLQGIIDDSNPGKKQIELLGVKYEIDHERESIKNQDSVDPLTMTLNEIELSFREKGPRYGQLWKSLKKARTKYSEHIRQKTKSIILPLCRSRLPDCCLPWLDALCAIHADGSLSYPQLLGTGGNDGHLDFGNNFMQRITSLLIGDEASVSAEFLAACLWNKPIQGLPRIKVGQFDPGRAGGYNQGMGVEAKDFKANPWDYVLTIEGTLLFASSVARRQTVSLRPQLTSPFTVRFSPVGFTSSEYTEPSGGESELWMPLWDRLATYAEIKQLFSEGRSSLGRRHARSGLEFSRAVGVLGVDRGISAFERYAFITRRGKSKVALPAGNIPVRYRPSLEIFNEIDPLISKLDQFMRGFRSPPASYARARQDMDEALFGCALRPDTLHFTKVIRSLGRMESLLAQRDRTKEPKLSRALFGLSPRWISLGDEGSVEIRIASALASIQPMEKVGSLRSNMAGVSPKKPWQWDDQNSQQHWFGSNLAEKLGNIVLYRLMDAERKSVPDVPFTGNVDLSPYDVMPFLNGETDDIKIEELLWGFTLINWGKPGLIRIANRWRQPIAKTLLSRTWCLLKLLHSPSDVQGHAFKREKSVSSLVQAGRIDNACGKAIQRLQIANIHPYRIHFEEELSPARLLASLLIPVKDHHLLEALVLEKSTVTGGVYV
jgi:CRISPR-associated protein Csx17